MNRKNLIFELIEKNNGILEAKQAVETEISTFIMFKKRKGDNYG